MNEVYYEETSFPYDYDKQKILLIVCKVAIGFTILMGMFFTLVLLLSPIENGGWIAPALSVGMSILLIVGLCLVKSRLYSCYDFIFVTGDIRIVKVVNTKKRKRIIVFDSSDVFQVGRFDSETYNKHRSAPGVKVIYAPTNKYEVEDKPKYYIGATVDGVKYLVVLECTEKFLVHVLQFAGKQVLEKEFK